MAREGREYDPDIVCYSVTTGIHMYMVGMNRKVKQVVPRVFIFGGPHPTFIVEFVKPTASTRSAAARASTRSWTS